MARVQFMDEIVAAKMKTWLIDEEQNAISTAKEDNVSSLKQTRVQWYTKQFPPDRQTPLS